MKMSQYFKFIKKRVDRKNIKQKWIKHVIDNSIKEEIQSDGRIRK